MYEVTYTIDGILKKMMINAYDALQANQIFTNMFTGNNYQIINIKRV